MPLLTLLNAQLAYGDVPLLDSAALSALPLPADVAQRFAAMAAESLALQNRMEERDQVPFEDWRNRYLSLEMLRP